MTETNTIPVTPSDTQQPIPLFIPEDDEISLLDLLQVVAENLRLLVLGPLLAGLLALAYSFTITPTFTATTKFMPPQQQQSSAAAMLAGLGALGGLASAAGIKSPADQYVAFLKSNSLKDALIDRFKLMDRLETKSREEARIAIGGSVLISNGKDGLITVEASDQDPAFAAQLANAHVEELGKLLSRLAVTEAQQRRLFFEKQLASAKENLVKSEKALSTSGINSSILKTTGASVTAVAQLKGQIAGQEIKLASMRNYLTDSAPEFKQAQSELSALRAQLAQAEKSEPALGKSSGDSDYISKLREFKYFETLFDLFTRQYEIARIDESREGAVIQVLDPAQPPERKSNPKKAWMAMLTTLVAVFALLLFIFIRHAVRSVAKDQDAAAKLSSLKGAFKKSLGQCE
jgi:tyrosine-protein kinase Etk/Wzc